MNAKVHDFDTATVRDFKYLAEALRYVSEHKITGYIVTPTGEVIDTRKGKRKSADGRKWVPCAAGMTVEPTAEKEKCYMPTMIDIMMNPAKHGYTQCGHCNGYGSSLKEAGDRCSRCLGSGLVPTPPVPVVRS